VLYRFPPASRTLVPDALRGAACRAHQAVHGLASRAITSQFTDQDFQAFARFMRAHRRSYPLFFAAKHPWVLVMDRLPSGISGALTHHVQLRANTAFRLVNRRQDRAGHRPHATNPHPS
jgi:hypothetical protein